MSMKQRLSQSEQFLQALLTSKPVKANLKSERVQDPEQTAGAPSGRPRVEARGSTGRRFTGSRSSSPRPRRRLSRASSAGWRLRSTSR